MKTAALVLANGCEELEGITVVDVLRRVGVNCQMIGLASLQVNGAHDITLNCQAMADKSLLDYDMVVFTGGMDNAYALRDDADLAQIMQDRFKAGKWNAAMCAAPIAFARYGILNGCKYTVYPGMNVDIEAEVENGTFENEMTVVDESHKIITSQGPATALSYAYALGTALGKDMSDIKKGMLYEAMVKDIKNN